MINLPLGKLPPELLEKHILSMSGARSRDVVVSPAMGLDFGVVRLKSEYLVVSSDPVTGVAEDIGWYAVNVSANDVATSGNRPQFMQSVLLFPETAQEGLVRRVAARLHGTARDLGITILGGHSEVTPGLRRTIAMVTAFAVVDSFITAAQARSGDSILMTKVAGLEGTSIIAKEPVRFGLDVPASTLRSARAFSRRLSVVEEATTAYKTRGVHAMHDCTEGGVLGALYEMASAARLGFEAEEARIPVAPETASICDALRADPLKLISSGSLLLAVARGKEKSVLSALAKRDIPVAQIGTFKEGRSRLVRRSGKVEDIRSAPVDELWRLRR